MVSVSSLGRFGPRRRLHGTAAAMASMRPQEGADASDATTGRPSTRETPERPRSRVSDIAGCESKQVADHPPAPLRGLALLEGEHPLEGSWFTGADREHDFEIRQGEGRLVSDSASVSFNFRTSSSRRWRFKFASMA